jgi:hypothetical protein
MALITIDDIVSGSFADLNVIQSNLDTIANELNGALDNTNISGSANIDPAKIANGGAVVQTEITTTGEAGKIPKLDSSGYLNLASGAKVYFYKDNT